jgi:hypothetical protein
VRNVKSKTWAICAANLRGARVVLDFKEDIGVRISEVVESVFHGIEEYYGSDRNLCCNFILTKMEEMFVEGRNLLMRASLRETLLLLSLFVPNLTGSQSNSTGSSFTSLDFTGLPFAFCCFAEASFNGTLPSSTTVQNTTTSVPK